MSGKNGKNNRSPLSHLFLFARNFFKHPAMLGSLIPSSPFLVNDLLGQIDWSRARVIVEYGPGIGTITREVLRRMHPDAVLVAIELNREFVEFLQAQIRDPRLKVTHGSASDVRSALAALGLGHADYIISGIPYSTMPDATRRDIVRQTREVLQPDGTLLVYQFTAAVLPELKAEFGSVREGFQFLNILPAQIFHCTP